MTLNDKQKNELGVDLKGFAKDVDFKQLNRDENGTPIYQGAVDLFDDSRLDEMQQSYSYKIAFGCFKFMFWFCLLMSLAMYVCYMMYEQLPYLVCSYASMAAFVGVYTYYAVKTSSKGVMDPTLAERFGKQSFWATAVGYLILVLMFSWISYNNTDIGLTGVPLYIAAYSLNLIIIVCAKRNNKYLSDDE